MRFVRDYPHSPAQVWAALVDPAQLAVWLWPCKSFEARLGGVGVFDPGREFSIRVTEFEPERAAQPRRTHPLRAHARPSGCRLTLDLKRPPDGWSPMGLAGFHGWLGRLSRLLAGRPQEETEAWALGIWNAVFRHCEWEVRRFVSGGAKVIWRIHFAECDAEPDRRGRRRNWTNSLNLLLERDLSVTIDGFGDDPCSAEDEPRPCAPAAVEATSAYLQDKGVEKARINIAFVLGNYHYLVERDVEAGRAFNRRIELRPVCWHVPR